MTALIPLAIAMFGAIVLAYAVWATRDVLLRRQHADARMDALEQKCDKAITNLAEEMRDTIADIPQRVQRLEGKKGGEALAATQDWRPRR